MTARRLTLLLILYVALDFANPLMPGAVTFDAADCTDGVHSDAARGAGQLPAGVFVPSGDWITPPTAAAVRTPRPAAPRLPGRWLNAVRRPSTPLAEPPGSVEDH